MRKCLDLTLDSGNKPANDLCLLRSTAAPRRSRDIPWPSKAQPHGRASSRKGIVQAGRHNRNRLPGSPLSQDDEPGEAGAERHERGGGRSFRAINGINIGVSLWKNDDCAALDKQPYRICHGTAQVRRHLSGAVGAAVSVCACHRIAKRLGAQHHRPARSAAGPFHEPAQRRTIDPIERDDKRKRAGQCSKKHTGVIKMMVVPSGDQDRTGRRDSVCPFCVHVKGSPEHEPAVCA